MTTARLSESSPYHCICYWMGYIMHLCFLIIKLMRKDLSEYDKGEIMMNK